MQILPMFFDVCYGMYEPDLTHAVNMVSRYMHNPRKGHWQVVKWIPSQYC